MFAELYIWIKLVHIVTALAFFGLEGAAGIHSKALHQAQDFAVLRAALARLGAAMSGVSSAVLIILLSGLTMMFTAWGWHTAWVNLALGLFLVNFVLAQTIDLPWAKTLGKALEGRSGAVTPEVWAMTEDPRMRFSHTFKTGADFALVFLMTVKPGLWLALGGAALIVVAYFALVAYTGTARPATPHQAVQEA
ncbi:MAG TPA: hypothetical protein VFS50_15915 [Meiothermus sp.]|jgi:uncharacterized membrane protein|nr:hypothetical protein [Meiothermus sp.]